MFTDDNLVPLSIYFLWMSFLCSTNFWIDSVAELLPLKAFETFLAVG